MPGMDQPRIGRKNDTGTDDLLEFYGFKVHDDIIMEPRQNVAGPVQIQGQTFLANYPTFVASTKLPEKHLITDGLKAVVLPFASSIDLIKDKQPEMTYTEIAGSTAEAWRQSGFFLFDPQNAKLKVGEDKGPFAFAYAAEGKLKSFFAGKPAPQADGSAAAPGTSAPGGDEPTVDESKGPARIVLVADSEFASDEYLQIARHIPTYGLNLQFFMGMVDWMAQDQTLSAARAKTVTAKPLTFTSEATPTIVKYGNIVGVPLAFVIYGIARWRIRTTRRKNAKV
jgi:ABC-type uncharacterized transport system involved in gliding motility auxiliary subunit